MQLIGHIRARDFRIRWVALAIITFCVANAAFAQQPNIVIINIDDMGWGDFGAYGSSYSQTPNIDRLATEGTRFTQFYTGAPDLFAVSGSANDRPILRPAPASTPS